MGEYDHAMKLLVDADPLALARFVLRQNERTRHLAEAEQSLKLVSQLNTEFQGTEARADGLLMLEYGPSRPFLAHIEFQSSHDTTMGERMVDYGHRVRQKYGPLPIAACVIYLREDEAVQEPPYYWPFFEGPPTLTFDYTCIKLWEVERAELLGLNRPALLPLALLTKGGANRRIVKEMFQELLSNRLHDLLPVGQTIAGWLLKGLDLEWLKREYQNMLELFKDSPAYQWMTEDAREEGLARGLEQGLERGLEQGLEQGREEMRGEVRKAQETFRQTLVTLVDERYPVLTGYARKQVQVVDDLERLQRAILRVSLSKDASDASRALDELSADTEE